MAGSTSSAGQAASPIPACRISRRRGCPLRTPCSWGDLAVDPRLEDFSYGPESYDAANLIALAAQAAKNDTGKGIASQLINVSKGGEKCSDFKSCKALLDQGKDIDYNGVSGPVEFNDVGDPAIATIGIYQYGADNKYTNLDYKTGDISG